MSPEDRAVAQPQRTERMRALKMYEAAKQYTSLGWRVVPVYVPTQEGCTCGKPECRSPGKHPTLHGWTERNFTAEEWANGSQHNLGIKTGAASGIVVIDVDAGGEATLSRLEREHGPLPTTVQERTGSGGRHILLRHPGVLVRNDARKRLGPGLDVRGDGGFIVAAPSLHKSGRRYEWIAGHAPGKVPIATMPDWLVELVRERERPAAPPRTPVRLHGNRRERRYAEAALESAARNVVAAIEGARNHTLNREAFGIGQLVSGGVLSRAEAEDALEAAGLDAGLSVTETRATVRSGLDSGAKEPRGVPPREPGEDDGDEPPPPESENPKGPGETKPAEPYIRAVLTRMSTVQPKPVRWLWTGRMAFGKFTMLDGDPGSLKTTVALDVAARLTRGRPMPGEQEALCGPVRCLIVSAEDDAADTIRPRLEAAGADLDLVEQLAIDIGDAHDLLPILSEHMKYIEDSLAKSCAKLLVLDPLAAMLGSKIDMHKDQDVRRVLGPLKTVLERTGAASVGIRHFNKARGGGSSLYAGSGSIGIAGAARSVLAAARNPQNPVQRVLALAKSNHADVHEVPSLAYHCEVVQLGEVETIRIVWDGVVAFTADELLAAQVPESQEERSALDEAKAVVLQVLSAGPVLSTELAKQAKTAGVAPRTLARARAALRVQAVFHHGKRWMVSLPNRGHSTVGDLGDLSGSED